MQLSRRDVLLGGLKTFMEARKVATKGPLAVMLFLTRRAKENGLPFPIEKLRTEQKGQVAGLGREPVQKILSDHGIQRVLAEEGGRTSRGSLGLAEDYVKFMNELYAARKLNVAELAVVEKWWIARVDDYFNRQCFRVDVDPIHSISKVVASILAEARKRQQEMPGLMVEGAVLQHLVGAKLALVLGREAVEHHGSSVADAADARRGDFNIGAAAIHVTTAPTEQLLAKCKANISAGARPIIVCPKDKVAGALLLADNAGIKDRLEVYEAEVFISTNIHELGKFEGGKIKSTTLAFLEAYNEIVKDVENDPSLQIELK